MQSLIECRRLVEIEWRFRKPCRCLLRSLLERRKSVSWDEMMDSRILQQVHARAMGR